MIISNSNDRIESCNLRFLQSPHCAANCLQHIHSSDRGYSHATHPVLITCNLQCATGYYYYCCCFCFFAGHLIFQLRRRSADYKRRSKRQRAVSHDDLRKAHDHPATQADRLPYLIELNPRGGTCCLVPVHISFNMG